MKATPTVKRLNERGQCCGRKPLVYKRPTHRLNCGRCSAEFDPTTGEQIESWAYIKIEGGFVSRYDDRTNEVFDPVTQTYQPNKAFRGESNMTMPAQLSPRVEAYSRRHGPIAPG